MQTPSGKSNEQQNESSPDDLVNDVYGPSQRDIDRSWDGYETGGSSRKLRGAVWKVLIAVVALVVLASMSVGILGPLFGGSSNSSQPAPPERISVEVLRVIDGRTIVVDDGNSEQIVRLIGIEIKPFGDPFHDFAQQVTESWIDGKIVLLEDDERDSDDQGRLMRYVFLDNVMINAALILNGLGASDTERPNIRYDGYLVDMERQARESGAGIWDERFQDDGDTADSAAWLRSHNKESKIAS